MADPAVTGAVAVIPGGAELGCGFHLHCGIPSPWRNKQEKKKEIVSFICYEASAFSVSFELLCCEQMHSAGGAPAKPGQLSGM